MKKHQSLSWKLIGILVPIVILAFFYSITLNPR